MKSFTQLYSETIEEQNPVCKTEPDGTKWWFLNNKLHRVDGPAIESPDGRKLWYLNDELHRVGGPAVEYLNGDKEYYLNDKEYSEEEYNKIMKNFKPEDRQKALDALDV